MVASKSKNRKSVGLAPITSGSIAPSEQLSPQIAQIIKNTPVLSAQEERHLAELVFEKNDSAAAEKLIMSHLRFVVYIARGFLNYHLPFNDLVQEGLVGLMKAVSRFDPRQKVRLTTFSVFWIKAEIQEYIVKNWRQVKIATTKAQRKLFFNLRRLKKQKPRLEPQDVKMIATTLDVKESDVLEMEKRMSNPEISFDPFEDEGEQISFVESNLQDDTADPQLILQDNQITADMLSILRQGLNILDARSRDIIESRWLSEKKEPFKTLAKKYEISIERVRQIEQSSMSKLRALWESKSTNLLEHKRSESD